MNAIKHNNHANRYKGFTIIELLVVIVIIGVLVAITAIAYTGIQGQAKAAITKADLNSFQKGIELYAIQHDNAIPVNDSEI